MDIETVSKAIGLRRYNYSCEAELQTGIESVLLDSSIPFSREHNLTKKDRVDFQVGGLAIEIKVGGSLVSVLRQLHRYAQNDEVKSILLVTSKAAHRRIPREMNGKPVQVLYLNPL